MVLLHATVTVAMCSIFKPSWVKLSTVKTMCFATLGYLRAHAAWMPPPPDTVRHCRTAPMKVLDLSWGRPTCLFSVCRVWKKRLLVDPESLVLWV